MDDVQLNKLSLLELQDLQAQLHIAIRAKIRAQQAEMAARSRGAPAPAAIAEEAHAPAIDLAQERDAWLAKRRAGSRA